MYGVIAKTGSQTFIFCLTDSEQRARSLYQTYKFRSIKSTVIGIAKLSEDSRIGDNFNGVITA